MISEEGLGWGVSSDLASGNAFKHFRKKHRREFVSCFVNLQKVQVFLSEGISIGQVGVGFLRSEGDGLWRVGQSQVRYAKESRLYFYAEEETRTLHLLGIGTKETQEDDIREAKEAIRKAFRKTE
jgi:putative component of toxin-antitoxin plasmid stabilization module